MEHKEGTDLVRVRGVPVRPDFGQTTVLDKHVMPRPDLLLVMDATPPLCGRNHLAHTLEARPVVLQHPRTDQRRDVPLWLPVPQAQKPLDLRAELEASSPVPHAPEGRLDAIPVPRGQEGAAPPVPQTEDELAPQIIEEGKTVS